MNFIKGLFVLVALTLVGLCYAQTFTPDTVGTGSVQTAQAVKAGVVIDVMPVAIRKEASGEQRAAGATLGGIAGALLGRRSNGLVQTAAVVAGGLAGDAVARKEGVEVLPAQQVLVKLDGGERIISIIQAVQPAFELKVGQAVYVIGAGDSYDPWRAPQPLRVFPQGRQFALSN